MIAKLAASTLMIGWVMCLSACSEGDPATQEAVESAAQTEPGELTLPKRVSVKPLPVPKFGEILHVPQKKANFFEFMQQKVELANDHVWAEREFVLEFREKHNAGLTSETEMEQFTALVERYDLEEELVFEPEFYDKLLTRVDVVPASLVLAQAANESGWGTSRFATEGRNFFGIWCYKEGCGIKPSSRNSGSKHEVRKFKTVQQGVNFYTHNINMGHAYDDLRRMRAELREDNEALSGVELAHGLIRYSERGTAYVEEIQRMIKQNDLSAFNKIRSP